MLKKPIMKKATLLILSIIFGYNAFGQIGNEKMRILYNQRQNPHSRAQVFRGTSGVIDLPSYQNPDPQIISNYKSAQGTKQRLDSIISELWVDASSSWLSDYIEKYQYDSYGNITSETDLNWSAVKLKWVEDSKDESVYDNNGNRTLYTTYYWNSSTVKWAPLYRNEYFFTPDGKIDFYIESYRDGGANLWVNNRKFEYSYDAGGNLVLYSEFSRSGNSWLSVEKQAYTNDANGNRTSQINYHWDEAISEWFFYFKMENLYDENGYLTKQTESNYNQNTASWSFSYKLEPSRDLNGNVTLINSYLWDLNTSQWIPYLKMEYTFDNSWLKADLIIPFYYYADKESFTHLLTQQKTYLYNNLSTAWTLDSRESFYYSQQIISNTIDNNIQNSINIYPNPASDYVSFTGSKDEESFNFVLYDLQGKTVKSQMVSFNTPFSVQFLTKGLYLYRFTNNCTVFSGKLQVK
jgi:hypothetical protein